MSEPIVNPMDNSAHDPTCETVADLPHGVPISHHTRVHVVTRSACCDPDLPN